MPEKNGTGPMGAGPLTGRGFGNCAGRGQGSGRGRSRMLQAGGRFGFNAPEQGSGAAKENQELMRQNEALRSEMETIMKRLDEMEARTANPR